MEELVSADIHFLVALLASEEAQVTELKSDFAQWQVADTQVQDVLAGLVNDGTIGVTILEKEVFNDLDTNESIALIKQWEFFVQSPYQLFLTDNGYQRWDTDDWGITTKRAQHLMFSNQGSWIRV
jgi:hypothetical protein